MFGKPFSFFGIAKTLVEPVTYTLCGDVNCKPGLMLAASRHRGDGIGSCFSAGGDISIINFFLSCIRTITGNAI